MLELRCIEQLALCIQILKHQRICVFYEFSGIRGLCGQITLAVYELYEGQLVITSDTAVVFTESRCDMNDTGTVGHGYITVAGYEMCLFLLLLGGISRTLVQRLVLLVLQILTNIGLQYFVSILALFCKTSQNLVCQCLCNIIGITVGGLHLQVGLLRVHAQCHVGRKSPGGGGPCQEICILALYLETYDSGTLFDCLIALCHFVAGQRGSAARAVRNDLETLVQKSLIPDGLQCPPFGLDEIVIVGNIRVIHVRPETNGTGEIFPHSLVFPDALFTFIDERCQTVFLDLLLTIQTQQLLNFQLYGKSVSIPACLTGNHISLHGTVSGDHILDGTGLYMTDVGLTVGGRRSVVEGIGLAFLTMLHTFFENVVVFPEFLDGFLTVYEIQACGYLLVHSALPFLKKMAPSRNRTKLMHSLTTSYNILPIRFHMCNLTGVICFPVTAGFRSELLTWAFVLTAQK